MVKQGVDKIAFEKDMVKIMLIFPRKIDEFSLAIKTKYFF